MNVEVNPRTNHPGGNEILNHEEGIQNVLSFNQLNDSERTALVSRINTQLQISLLRL
jgi:hypothetical protein